MIFVCDICEWVGAVDDPREYHLELDLARELELDPFEEVEVEFVPIHIAQESACVSRGLW